MKNYILLILVAVFALGCSANYKNLYLPDQNYLARRNIETKMFDTDNEKSIIVASAQVLQDMGYTIKESEVSLGIITAEKNREAGSTAGKAAIVILAVLAGTQPQYEDTQRFYVNIVTTKMGHGVKTRVLFARRSWDNYGRLLTLEKIEDEALYKDFFEKLSQSVFLTANDL